MASDLLCFFLVGEPSVILPQGVTGDRPGVLLPSPPCGWSTGFMTVPRTVGLMPRCRLRPPCPPDVLVRLVADDADRRPALGAHPAALAAREPERHEVALAGRYLGARPCAARICAPRPGSSSTAWTTVPTGIRLRGSVLPTSISASGPLIHDGADRQVARRQDVALLAVVVVQERCSPSGSGRTRSPRPSQAHRPCCA